MKKATNVLVVLTSLVGLTLIPANNNGFDVLSDVESVAVAGGACVEQGDVKKCGTDPDQGKRCKLRSGHEKKVPDAHQGVNFFVSWCNDGNAGEPQEEDYETWEEYEKAWLQWWEAGQLCGNTHDQCAWDSDPK